MNIGKFLTGNAVAGTSRASKVPVLGASKNLDILGLPVGGLKIGPAGSETVITPSAAEINTLTNGAARFQAAGSTLTLDATHNRKIIKFDTLTGSVVTLPAASGSGLRYKFLVSVLATSNSHIVKVANAADFMVGIIMGTRVDLGNAVLGFAAANSGTVATNSDTITLNRTTTGSVSVGEWLELEDIAANTWSVMGMLSATGAAFATPFSAAV